MYLSPVRIWASSADRDASNGAFSRAAANSRTKIAEIRMPGIGDGREQAAADHVADDHHRPAWIAFGQRGEQRTGGQTGQIADGERRRRTARPSRSCGRRGPPRRRAPDSRRPRTARWPNRVPDIRLTAKTSPKVAVRSAIGFGWDTCVSCGRQTCLPGSGCNKRGTPVSLDERTIYESAVLRDPQYPSAILGAIWPCLHRCA